MNQLEPRVAGCERRIGMLDRMLRNFRPLVQQAYQGVRDGQDPYGQGTPGGGAGYIARAKVLTAVSSGTVDNPGIGGATLTLTGRSTPVYSIYDRTIKAGAGVMLGLEAGKWYVLSVGSCNDLVIPSAGDQGELPDISDHVFGAEGPAARSGYGRGFEETVGPVENPAGAAITRVQYATAHGNSGTAAAAFGGASTTGNSLFAVIVTNNQHVSSGPAGWSKVVGHSTDYVELWWKPAAAAATTVSFSLAGSNHWTVTIVEVHGLGATPSAGTTAEATASASSLSVGPVSLAGNGYVVAGYKSDDGSTASFSSPTGGFTLVDQAADGLSTAGAFLDKVAAAGSHTAGLTYGAVQGLYAVSAPFHP